jgi:phosphoribosyl 1,2-cyclic phosphodiesterase
MEFKAYRSSSKGNLYRVSSGGCHLLLEAGVPIKEIRRHLNGDGLKLSDMSACLISHEHKDHAMSAEKILKAGIITGGSFGTVQAVSKSMEVVSIRQYGVFRVQAFAVDHDAVNPVGYLIADSNDGLLFAVDTYDVVQTFCGLTIIAIECNYSDLIIDKEAVYINRLVRNHMSLERVLAFLARQDLSKCREIHLLHLSAGNSNEEAFIRAVQKQTGIPAYVAKE